MNYFYLIKIWSYLDFGGKAVVLFVSVKVIIQRDEAFLFSQITSKYSM